MKLEQQHIDFENNCKKFIGIKISKVEYAEIAYHLHDNSEPKKWFATKFDNIHTVDFCVFLHTQTNDVIEIYWDDTFFQFGIGVKLNLPSNFSGYQKWDVTNDALWADYINSEIKDISIGWNIITENLKRDIIYPQHVTIEFSNNKKMFLSAAELKSEKDNIVQGFSDNLLICNGENTARKVKMIL